MPSSTLLERMVDPIGKALTPDAARAIRFHIEHILPRQHGGTEESGNLAPTSPSCNWNKGPKMTAIDPETGRIAMLFNPRTQIWQEHFELIEAEIRGLTPIGRARHTFSGSTRRNGST